MWGCSAYFIQETSLVLRAGATKSRRTKSLCALIGAQPIAGIFTGKEWPDGINHHLATGKILLSGLSASTMILGFSCVPFGFFRMLFGLSVITCEARFGSLSMFGRSLC
jgi:hypothetical protein